jgi:hypothetical protein
LVYADRAAAGSSEEHNRAPWEIGSYALNLIHKPANRNPPPSLIGAELENKSVHAYGEAMPDSPMPTNLPQWLTLFLAILSILSVSAAVAENPVSNRFHQDVFGIGFWVDPPVDANLDARYAEIAEANFTFLIGNFGPRNKADVLRQIALSQKYGLKVICARFDMPPAELPADSACWGYFLGDEPGPGGFPDLRRQVDEIRAARPGKVAFINLLPNYAPDWALGTSYVGHVERFIHEVNPEVLSMDNYPHFLPNSDGRDAYCQNLEVFRAAALKAKIPFWNFFNTMSYGDHSDPTEAQLRWQINTSLAYGARAVMYFCYWTPSGDEFPKGGAIISTNGKKTRHYAEAKRINARVKNLGSVLMRLTSTGVYRCAPTNDPAAVFKRTPISSISPGDYLVGTFRHEDGRVAVMINNYHFAYSAWPTVAFNAPTNSIVEISPETGKEIPVEDDSPAMPGLQLSLDAGAGRLFLMRSK